MQKSRVRQNGSAKFGVNAFGGEMRDEFESKRLVKLCELANNMCWRETFDRLRCFSQTGMIRRKR